MLANIKDQEEFAKYKNRFFTDNGWEAAHRILGQYANMYVETSDEEFPIDLKAKGAVGFFGIPNFDYAMTIQSREELWGRMQMLSQLLGVKELVGQADNGEVHLKL